VQFSVAYDFPNNYCMVWAVPPEGCGDPIKLASKWPIPNTGVGNHVTRLILTEGGNELYNVPAIFENGTWLPTASVGCASTATAHTYTVQLANGSAGGTCNCAPSTSQTITVTIPAASDCTPDPRPCPGCGQ